MKITRFALAAVLWIGLLEATLADTHYVAQNGQTPVSPYTNGWSSAASNIQAAVDEAVASDTVLVSNGVYNTGGVSNYPSGSDLTNRVSIYNAITVRSANNDPTNTIIKGAWASDDNTNGTDAVRCVYMVDNSSLIGFTLTNGATFTAGTGEREGGGVYCTSASAIVSNCVITGNAAGSQGGGAYKGTLFNCRINYNFSMSTGAGAYNSALYNCALIGNSADVEGGGAIHCTLLYNCTVISNYSGNRGGAIFRSDRIENCLIAYNSAGSEIIGDNNAHTLTNCTIIGNSTASGYGVVWKCTLYNCTVISNSLLSGAATRENTNYNCLIAYNTATNSYGGGGCKSSFFNCTVVSNAAKRGGGVYGGPLICNSVIYLNTATESGANWYADGVNPMNFTNSCTFPTPSGGGITWPAGNITNNPQFVSSAGGNFRLSNISPCIDSGTNFPWMTDPADIRSKDLDGRPRLRYGRVDMGCYEYISKGTIVSFH